MHIHVANLPRDIDEAKLRALFGAYGAVTSVKIEMDKISGKPDGFAFIDMSDDEQAKAAIQGLRGKKLTEYPLALKEVDAPASGKPGHAGKAGRGEACGDDAQSFHGNMGWFGFSRLDGFFRPPKPVKNHRIIPLTITHMALD